MVFWFFGLKSNFSSADSFEYCDRSVSQILILEIDSESEHIGFNIDKVSRTFAVSKNFCAPLKSKFTLFSFPFFWKRIDLWPFADFTTNFFQIFFVLSSFIHLSINIWFYRVILNISILNLLFFITYQDFSRKSQVITVPKELLQYSPRIFFIF